MSKAPLNDEISVCISRMVDDAMLQNKREPSHYDIELEFKRVGLLHADPRQKNDPVGKAKRVRAVLNWAMENNLEAGEKLVYLLLSLVRSFGGFRVNSPNYIGEEVISGLVNSFKESGYILGQDGVISISILDNLNSVERHKVLNSYAIRARKGIEDAALITGTSKDLMEAVAAHIIQEIWGSYPIQANFPTLLGQAFTGLGLATDASKKEPKEPPQRRVERALYELACSINALRNKEGTGHGRPFLPNVTNGEAKLAIESIGLISEFMLAKLKDIK